MMSEQKMVVCLSGGIDSTTVMAYYDQLGYDCRPVNFIYPSKHNAKEHAAAASIANHYNKRLKSFDLSSVFSHFTSNLLINGAAIPREHYDHASQALTVVPGRNTIFLSVLMGYAQSINAEAVGIGIHQGDHAVYPDCRPKYFDAIAEVFKQATEGAVGLRAPLLLMKKSEVVTLGLRVDAPYHLTWTCYEGGRRACGECGACRERREAFELNGMQDPAYA